VLPLIALTISSCSLFIKPPVEVEIQTVEIPIEIAQPPLPRAIDMKEPKWYVVSDRRIPNPCLKDEETNETPINEDGSCGLGREHPDWPEGYTYLDRFLEDIVEESGALVFTAMSIADYELMSYNLQEIRRYVQEMNEVIIYYRKNTMTHNSQNINTNRQEDQ
jgi:hypothetical protein